VALGLRLAAVMRKFLGLPSALVACAACSAAAGEVRLPPALVVTAPPRGLVQDHAGMITVRGTVAPGDRGDPIDQVRVNHVAAAVQPDGTFEAVIPLAVGTSLIETSARDVGGRIATDTRAVQAGALRAVGSPIARALTVAVSADSFATLSAAAGPIVAGLDLASMLAPLQPMVHAGDATGEDCLFGRVFVDDLTFSDLVLSLAPVRGGLAFRAEIDGLAIPAHARYAVACLDGTTTLTIGASKVVIAGTLDVTPGGAAGFTTALVNPEVDVTGFLLDASGVPGDVLDLLHLDAAIRPVVAKGTELAMGPLINQALGALGGPQQVEILGNQLTIQVAPAAIAFDPAGAVVALDLTVALAGGDASPGFLHTASGTPTLDPRQGFQLGIADDLVNELLAEAQAAGLLDLSLPVTGGSFDGAQLHLALPPMLTADAQSGKLHIVLGDLAATYTSHGAPVARAAINATVDLDVAPAGGSVVKIELAPPQIHVDITGDLPNLTGLDDADLADASVAVLGAQIDAITQLLVAIPVPAIGGLKARDLSIGGGDGYVLVAGQLYAP